MENLENLKCDKEVLKLSKKILSDLQKKHNGDIAAMYAEADAEAHRLNTKAKTLGQVKKQVAYSKIESICKDYIVNIFMMDSGYTYGGKNENSIDFCWKKERAENGNNSDN